MPDRGGRFAGRTVVISGAARGQGRAHAIRFAEEGADLVLFDLCRSLETVPFPLATPADLEETEAAASAAGARVESLIADVRDAGQVAAVFERAVEAFGGVDIAVANAGVVGRFGKVWEIDDEVFRDVVDVNLVGAWHVLKLAVRTMRAGGRRGAVIVTGSGASLKGLPNISAYVASKHALVGLVRSAARECAPAGIRVNLVAPGNVNTPMLLNDAMFGLYVADQPQPTRDDFVERAAAGTPMGIPFVEPEEVSETVLFLASDAAKHITGAVLPVDGGSAIP